MDGKWEREKLCLAFEGIYSGVQNTIMTLKNLRCSQSVLFHCSCKVGWRGVENFAFFQEHPFPYEECFAPPPSDFLESLRVNQVVFSFIEKLQNLGDCCFNWFEVDEGLLTEAQFRSKDKSASNGSSTFFDIAPGAPFGQLEVFSRLTFFRVLFETFCKFGWSNWWPLELSPALNLFEKLWIFIVWIDLGWFSNHFFCSGAIFQVKK